MMQLYPAIDLLEGQAVRLRRGKRDDVTVYGDPVRLAGKWRSLGGSWLHLVDLGAAFDGASRDLPLIRRIVEAFDGPVELGGGLRCLDDIAARMDLGVSRCIIGSAAVDHPELVEQACARWPGRIACGIDAKDGLVATHGWVDVSQVTASALALRMKAVGVDTVIYTDISRDGMLQGPNVEATARLIRETGMQIVGSGGVSCLKDLRDLEQAGCAGAILGKALYEGAFTLDEALRTVKEG